MNMGANVGPMLSVRGRPDSVLAAADPVPTGTAYVLNWGSSALERRAVRAAPSRASKPDMEEA